MNQLMTPFEKVLTRRLPQFSGFSFQITKWLQIKLLFESNERCLLNYWPKIQAPWAMNLRLTIRFGRDVSVAQSKPLFIK